ncbi:hypothetical protein VEx25_1059 [Vibrio antiquarius]|uniref:Uncharacterized protein n=1 Tax=Vibrio antiquarius (strain Ex25) TaxID=150340 RepID=A0ABM9WXL2_VIBAE|nr:hypothetical protein VEx25_1059 [Vibrio antiquarius]
MPSLVKIHPSLLVIIAVQQLYLPVLDNVKEENKSLHPHLVHSRSKPEQCFLGQQA